MRRLLTAAALAVLLVAAPACDSDGDDERPSFRAEITGDLETTLAGQPAVTVNDFDGDPLYTFVLSSGFSSLGFSISGEPQPRTYGAEGATVLLFGDEPTFFVGRSGSVVVESVEGRLVRGRFAFDATEGFDGGGCQIRVEGTMVVDLDDRVQGPIPTPRP